MCLSIPYRLETKEDILRAQKENLLKLGEEYEVIRAVQRRLSIEKPPALEAAREVHKDFYRIKDEKREEVKVEHLERSGIGRVESFHRVELALPWVTDLARCRDFLDFLQEFPPEVRALVHATPRPATMAGELETVLASQKLIKDEALAISRTGRPRHMTREDLRRLIAGRALFEPGSRNLLDSLRSSLDDRPDAANIYQHMCCELLFHRIPALVSLLARIDPKLLRQKFLSRIAKIGVTPQQKMALYAYIPHDVTERSLFPAMEKVSAMARKILKPEQADLIDDHITGARHQAGAVKGLYDSLFLSPELRQMRRLYQPLEPGKVKRTVSERIVATHTHLATLSFYPTKDYMDVSKARFSGDCTGLDLSEKQLGARQFFNIRVFQKEKWIGNIYMLDFTMEQKALVVDRIQIPRDFNAEYLHFFRHLMEIFQEMFSSVEYRDILLPLRISNHGAIQTSWNAYRKPLKRREVNIDMGASAYFESVDGARGKGRFYVLK